MGHLTLDWSTDCAESQRDEYDSEHSIGQGNRAADVDCWRCHERRVVDRDQSPGRYIRRCEILEARGAFPARERDYDRWPGGRGQLDWEGCNGIHAGAHDPERCKRIVDIQEQDRRAIDS